MPQPRRRARFQIHLSTAVAMMFVAGALIWANVDSLYSEKFENFDYFIREYGWPFTVAKDDYFNPRAYGHEAPPERIPEGFKFYDYCALKLSADILIALLILLATWFLCEWLIRRRAARKGA